MAALLGAIAGAAVGLLYTAAKDLLESDGPDPQKIQQVKDAIAAREQELIGQGVDPMEANLTAGDEFKQALAEASQSTDGTTFGDYIGNTLTGASIGAGAALIPSVGRGLTAGAGKLKSFLPAANKAAPTVATEQELAQLGTQAAKRQASIRAAEGQRLAEKTAKGMNAPAPTIKPRSASEIRQEIAARESGGRRIDSDDPIYYELEKALDAEDVYSAGFRSPSIAAMRRGSGDRVIPIGGNIGYSPETRASLVGKATGGSHPMEGASSKLGKLVQGDVWPEEAVAVGRLGMRSPRTIETTAELVSPGIGMADDALLNPAVDDIIDAAMAPVARRIGYRLNGRVPMPTIDPTQGAMSIPSFLR